MNFFGNSNNVWRSQTVFHADPWSCILIVLLEIPGIPELGAKVLYFSGLLVYMKAETPYFTTVVHFRLRYQLFVPGTIWWAMVGVDTCWHWTLSFLFKVSCIQVLVYCKVGGNKEPWDTLILACGIARGVREGAQTTQGEAQGDTTTAKIEKIWYSHHVIQYTVQR